MARDERGASLVEYLMLVALIAVICIIAVTQFGHDASSKFDYVGTRLGTTTTVCAGQSGDSSGTGDGQNCHTFQDQAMRHCGLRKQPPRS